MRGPSGRRWARRACIAWTAVVGLGLLAPVVLTLAGAISPAGHGSVFALCSGGLRRSLEVVAVVVPLALLLGAPAAYAFRRCPFPGSHRLERAALLPLSVPGVALAFALLLAAGSAPRFWLLAAGHLAYTVPLVVKVVGRAVDGLDPLLEPAARSLGAGSWETLRRVVLPLLVPALVLAALLVFAVSWGELNVSFLLATPRMRTFPASLYRIYTASPFPVAAAATLVFLLPMVPAVLAIQALGGGDLHRGPQP